jgi:two-component system cell cycle response regulator
VSDAPPPASTVLIVDDNVQNLELLEAYLEVPGITTLRAGGGREALDLVAARRPDLILLDIMMPRMSGFEVCKILKSDPATRDIPIVVVTALSEVSDQERASDLGADDFITQPVGHKDLLALVMKHLKARREPRGAN